MSLSDETRLLLVVSEAVFGRTNAWTTVADDPAIATLMARGLLERYSEGVRITPAGLDALQLVAERPTSPEELERLERERCRAR